MKKIVFFCLPYIIYASSFTQVIQSIDNNEILKSKKEGLSAKKALIKSMESQNYPIVDISLNGVRLKDTPTSVFNIPGYPPMELPVGTKENFSIELSVKYPLFSGYAITNSIKKSKLEYLKEKLKIDELKRELYMKTLYLYGYIYASNMAIIATKKGLDSVESSYKKAKGLFENGLINMADLYNIESKKYEIEAKLKSYKSSKEELVSSLKYLIKREVEVKELPKISFDMSEKELGAYALKNREDLKSIKVELEIDDVDIKLNKSRYYPSIALFGAIKRDGDDLSFDGNGYSNKDKSYIGATIKWNIFDGFKKDSDKEALVIKKNARFIYFNDYKNLILKDIKNAFLKLDSLKFRKKASIKEVESKEGYYKLIKGRFENSLCSADELSRAIANLAEAEAKLEKIKADIFIQKCQILLLGGKELFLSKINL